MKNNLTNRVLFGVQRLVFMHSLVKKDMIENEDYRFQKDSSLPLL